MAPPKCPLLLVTGLTVDCRKPARWGTRFVFFALNALEEYMIVPNDRPIQLDRPCRWAGGTDWRRPLGCGPAVP